MNAKRMIPALALAASVAMDACGKGSDQGEATAGPGAATGDSTGSMSTPATGTTTGAGPAGGTVTTTAADSTGGMGDGTGTGRTGTDSATGGTTTPAP